MEGHMQPQEAFMPPEAVNLKAIRGSVESKAKTDKIREAFATGHQQAFKPDMDQGEVEHIKSTGEVATRPLKERLKDFLG